MFGKVGQPFKISIIYVILGLVWIYSSTLVLNSYFQLEEERHVNSVQVIVRLSFVFASAILFFFLIKRSNKSLERKAKEFNNLFERNPNPMWIYDVQTYAFLAVNEAALMQYGFSRKEFLSKTILDIRPKEDEHRVKASLMQIQPHIYSSGLWRHLKKNGELIWVEITSSPVEWEGKDAELILSHNVTARVQAEWDLRELNASLEERIQERTQQLDNSNQQLSTLNEQLITSNEELLSTNDQLASAQDKILLQAEALVRQSEDKLNRIMTNMKDVVWSAHVNNERKMEIDFINNATLDIYGYPPEAFLKNTNLMTSLIPEEDRERVVKDAYEQLTRHSYLQNEHRVTQWNGKSKWVNSRAWLTTDENGKPTRVDGLITDITHRKETELELLTQKETLQKVIDSIPLIITLMDRKGVIIFVNKAWESILQWKSYEVIGKNMTNVFFADEELRKKALEFADRADGTWADFKTLTKSGRSIDISWFVTKRSDGSIIGIGQDNSARKKQEEEKAHLMEQLAIQNNDLVQFSFIASHNLRGPVATMLGLTQIIKLLPAENTELTTILQHLYTSVDKLNEVIKDLTMILEVRNDHFQAKQWVNIQDIFDQIMKNFTTHFDLDSIDIRTDFTAHGNFFTIKNYLYSILYNLITNAVKFRSPDRRTVIEIKTFQTQKTAGFRITDNGVGIDLERFGQKIFTLYQRFHLEVEGKGLGLYLVQTQVYSLNGSIDIASQSDKGTTVTVSFPLPTALNI